MRYTTTDRKLSKIIFSTRNWYLTHIIGENYLPINPVTWGALIVTNRIYVISNNTLK